MSGEEQDRFEPWKTSVGESSSGSNPVPRIERVLKSMSDPQEAAPPTRRKTKAEHDAAPPLV